jgi:hypothetical protein
MTKWVQARSALFGIQWYAMPDGRLDRTIGPSLPDALAWCRDLGFAGFRIEVPPELTVAQYAQLLADHNRSAAPGYLPVGLDDQGRGIDGVLDRGREHRRLRPVVPERTPIRAMRSASENRRCGRHRYQPWPQLRNAQDYDGRGPQRPW